MTIFNSINEAKAALKAKTGSARVRYFVKGREVSPSVYRQAMGKELIYRSGLFIHAEK